MGGCVATSYIADPPVRVLGQHGWMLPVKKLVVGPWVGSIGPPLVCTGRVVPSAGDALLALTGRVVPPGSADVAFRTPLAPYEKSKSLGSGGSMVARLKLKGIDGRAPPGVEPAA
ncbi:hypothetical protein VNO80_32097 [Phaseolus coccineus]|uniref:Uncharacterized protein n=1 Tax=Phaseolus coccineus TaxID=3886 RepID=A0AAN9Q9U1_PHACN